MNMMFVIHSCKSRHTLRTIPFLRYASPWLLPCSSQSTCCPPGSSGKGGHSSRQIRYRPYVPPAVEEHDLKNMLLKRPMSPGLEVYAPTMPSLTSIFQRATGVVVTLYALVLSGSALFLPHGIETLVCFIQSLNLGKTSVLIIKVALFKISLCFTTSVMNVVVLIALRQMYENRKPDYNPLRSLVLADLVIGLCVQPWVILTEFGSINLDLLNRLKDALDMIFWTGSVLSTCLLCWVRYTSITTPFACRALRAKPYLKFVWALATAVAIPALLLPSENRFWKFGYRIVYSLVAFYIPAGMMVFWYVGIVGTIRKPLDVPMQTFRGGAPWADTDQSNVTERERIRSRQRPARRNITFIMIMFICTSMPYFVVLPLEALGVCVPPLLRDWLRWLRFLNSAVNPLIYAIGSPSVRRVLRAFLTRSTPTDRATTDGATTDRATTDGATTDRATSDGADSRVSCIT